MPTLRSKTQAELHVSIFIPCDTFSSEVACSAGDLNTTAKCGVGFSGSACSDCQPAFFKFFDNCHACDYNGTGVAWTGQVLNVGLVVAMIVLWLVINNYLCEIFDTLDVFLSFVQMANVRFGRGFRGAGVRGGVRGCRV